MLFRIRIVPIPNFPSTAIKCIHKYKYQYQYMKASYTANNYMPYNNSPGIGLANQLAIASYLFEII